jgi:hypothetical protein
LIFVKFGHFTLLFAPIFDYNDCFLTGFRTRFLKRQQYGVYTRQQINIQGFVWEFIHKQRLGGLDTGRKTMLPRFPFNQRFPLYLIKNKAKTPM